MKMSARRGQQHQHEVGKRRKMKGEEVNGGDQAAKRRSCTRGSTRGCFTKSLFS